MTHLEVTLQDMYQLIHIRWKWCCYWILGVLREINACLVKNKIALTWCGMVYGSNKLVRFRLKIGFKFQLAD